MPKHSSKESGRGRSRKESRSPKRRHRSKRREVSSHSDNDDKQADQQGNAPVCVPVCVMPCSPPPPCGIPSSCCPPPPPPPPPPSPPPPYTPRAPCGGADTLASRHIKQMKKIKKTFDKCKKNQKKITKTQTKIESLEDKIGALECKIQELQGVCQVWDCATVMEIGKTIKSCGHTRTEGRSASKIEREPDNFCPIATTPKQSLGSVRLGGGGGGEIHKGEGYTGGALGSGGRTGVHGSSLNNLEKICQYIFNPYSGRYENTNIAQHPTLAESHRIHNHPHNHNHNHNSNHI